MTEPNERDGRSDRHSREYQDPHYHDDDLQLPPPDETQPEGKRLHLPRKPRRKVLPPRRHYED